VADEKKSALMDILIEIHHTPTLAANPALRQRLGAAGYAYALAHLDRDAVLQRFEADALALLSV
jgi:hypothetical protein